MIRHGETEANAARLMAGSLDSPLTSWGREQAARAAKVVEALPVKPAAIIHSQLSRARDTAAILNQNLGVPAIEDADFAEMHAGDWEGIPYDTCHEMLHGWDDPPGGETHEEFFARIKRAKIKALSHTDQPVLIVCHGGVFRAFAKLYGIDSYGVRNCHLYEFEPAGNPVTGDFPWRGWHYEYFDGENEALLCDCSLEGREKMTRPSAMQPNPAHQSVEIAPRIFRTACDIFRPGGQRAREIAS